MEVPILKMCVNRWQGNNPSWYAQNGIITFTVDHRGSGQFGKKGLDYIYRCLGKWEILDYEDAVKWLLAKPFVDGSKDRDYRKLIWWLYDMSGTDKRCRLLDTWICRTVSYRLQAL